MCNDIQQTKFQYDKSTLYNIITILSILNIIMNF